MTLLVFVTGHRATPKKRGAVKDKLFPAFISRRGAACSVPPAMIHGTVYIFLGAALRCAALRGAGQRGVWWGRSLSETQRQPGDISLENKIKSVRLEKWDINFAKENCHFYIVYLNNNHCTIHY